MAAAQARPQGHRAPCGGEVLDGEGAVPGGSNVGLAQAGARGASAKGCWVEAERERITRLFPSEWITGPYLREHDGMRSRRRKGRREAG